MVVPAFNEGSDLARNLETLLRFLANERGPYQYEIIVVDDGSSDETFAIAQELTSSHENLRVFRQLTNRGLGAAIRTGMEAARGSVVVLYDSDLSYEPKIISRLLDAQASYDADIVLASPYMKGGCVTGVPWVRKQLSREANRYLSFATNGRYATITCMVRAYRREFIRTIECTEDRMEVNVELLFKALKRGASVVEIPAHLKWSNERARSRSRLNPRRTVVQIWRTLCYGVAHRPSVVLAIPGIAPGVLPLIVALCLVLHLSLKTTGLITLVTVVIQNTSLAFFAGQLAVFGRNVYRRRASEGQTYYKGPGY